MESRTRASLRPARVLFVARAAVAAAGFAQAEKAGLTNADTTIDKILAGTYTSRPGRKTLEALAQLSDLPLAVVYEAAKMELPQARLADQLPSDVDSPSRNERL